MSVQSIQQSTCLQVTIDSSLPKLNETLQDVKDIARCMVGSLKNTKKVTLNSFSDDLIRQLNHSIYIAETLLKPIKNPNSALVAETFYQLGILIGAAEAQIFSAYTHGVTAAKKSQGGRTGGQKGIYQKYEVILLRHFCRLHLKLYRNHGIALKAFNTATKLSMPRDTWSRLYNKFRRGEKLWQTSKIHMSPDEASNFLIK